MDFTELYKQTGQICRFSPNGAYIAVVVLHRIVVRDAETLEIEHLFTATETLNDLVWSPDSQLIAGICAKANFVQVWRLEDPDWAAKVVEGPLTGLTNAIWSPDSRHVITFSDYGLRVTIWSLLTKSSVYIQFPKHSDKGFAFRPDGRYLALLERHDAKDTVGIYNVENWSLSKSFSLETTDADNLIWSPDGRYLAVWDHPMEYRIFVYYPDGRLLGKYSAYDLGLGIKSVKWSPSGQFLAVGSYDQKIRLLNQYTWKSSIDISHPEKLIASDIMVYKEVMEKDKKSDPILSKWARMMLNNDQIRYEVTKSPVNVPSIKPSTEKPNPKIGIGMMEFSPDGRWLLSRNDNMPSCLWLFDMVNLRQNALIMQATSRDAIRCVAWNPVYPDQFVFLSSKTSGVSASTDEGGKNVMGRTENKSHVYLWRGEDRGLEAIEIPAENFGVNSVTWNPDGRSLVLMDHDKFCVAFPLDDLYHPGYEGADELTDEVVSHSESISRAQPSAQQSAVY